ncbi:DUF1754-domain-containing protein [Aspergillus steynii IBT 23096]|uniref:DUF1754-domain-containing protein n=1 Tax=Aspergillus steynii IBT 23096 TaxID=1392250 RepID=A0A2I2FS85_9EURO|nr:DUF1754-domain-containing protein [Aspergillus steynii IBT 23096]PLB43491.1 DUF1754-domain-containing protein [Aspergillus steynii IBT 23096]
MPPGSEYASGGGGKLKLKGSKVSDGRVDKKKKKAKKREEEKKTEEARGDDGHDKNNEEGQVQGQGKPDDEVTASTGAAEEDGGVVVGKTEAERKYEDAKKKRLQERLKRDGVKTHKERVEELNKYLSRLSEHHDMPKIGPG